MMRHTSLSLAIAAAAAAQAATKTAAKHAAKHAAPPPSAPPPGSPPEAVESALSVTLLVLGLVIVTLLLLFVLVRFLLLMFWVGRRAPTPILNLVGLVTERRERRALRAAVNGAAQTTSTACSAPSFAWAEPTRSHEARERVGMVEQALDQARRGSEGWSEMVELNAAVEDGVPPGSRGSSPARSPRSHQSAVDERESIRAAEGRNPSQLRAEKTSYER